MFVCLFAVTQKAVQLFNAKEHSVMFASLQILKSLLDGGNEDVQGSLFEFFRINNEEFFNKIQYVFQFYANLIKEVRSLRVIKWNRFDKEERVCFDFFINKSEDSGQIIKNKQI